jgi:uncharacterized protein (DUF58 family)
MCRWIVDAEREGYHYGLRLPGFEISPARGEIHQGQLLRVLALYQPNSARDEQSTID